MKTPLYSPLNIQCLVVVDAQYIIMETPLAGLTATPPPTKSERGAAGKGWGQLLLPELWIIFRQKRDYERVGMGCLGSEVTGRQHAREPGRVLEEIPSPG